MSFLKATAPPVRASDMRGIRPQPKRGKNLDMR